MTIERIIRIMAGSFVLLSLALGYHGSPVFISEWFLAFTAFVGLNLAQSGITQSVAQTYKAKSKSAQTHAEKQDAQAQQARLQRQRQQYPKQQ